MKSKKITHREKQRMARRHMSYAEIRAKVPMFESKWWMARKDSIVKKIAKKKERRVTHGSK